MKSTVSEKGQVTIPKPIRERLGIQPGAVLEFAADEGGRVVAKKVVTRDPVDDAYGILDLKKGTDEFIASVRGEADAG